MRYLVTAVLVLAPFATLGSETKARSLKGLKTVSVLIEELTPEIQQAGVSSDSLRTHTELSLRKMGLKVVDTDDHPAGVPFVLVNVSGFRVGTAGYVLTVAVSLHEICTPVRMKMLVPCSTWDTSFTLTANNSGVPQYVQQAVDEGLTNFQNDLLQARGG
jgi:hypothetical protein